MIDIPVTSAMSEQVPVVQSDCSIREAASHLRDPEVPALIVRDSTDIDGIVTESDLVALLAEGGFTHPVESCMSTPVVTTRPTTPVGLAADRMRDAGISLLPVVDDSGDFHGVVTRETLAPFLSRQRLGITWDGEPLAIDGDPSEAELSQDTESSDSTVPGDAGSSNAEVTSDTGSSDAA